MPIRSGGRPSLKQQVLIGVAVSAAAGIATLGVPAAGAEVDELPPFLAAAVADGMRMSLNSPGAPVTANIMDGGGPTSESLLSSASGIRSYAALPYPGDIFLAGPSTVAGFAGAAGFPLPFAAPEYPLIAKAEQPGRPEHKVGDGVYALEATTSDTSSVAIARAGFDSDGQAQAFFSRSETSAVQSDGVVISKARTESRGVKAGPLVLSSVTSLAQVQLEPSGALTRKSSLEVVMGGADGTPLVLKSPGDASSLAEPVAQLNKQLEPSGVQLSVSPARETPEGVFAPVLWIRMFTPNSAISRAATTTISAGRTGASIRTEATAAEAATSEAEATPAAQETASSPAPPAPSGSAAEPGTAGAAVTPAPVKGTTAGSDAGRNFLESSRRPGTTFLSESTGGSAIVPEVPGGDLAGGVGAPDPSLAEAQPSAAAASPAGETAALAGSGRPIGDQFDVSSVYVAAAAVGAVGLGFGAVFKARSAWNF